MLKHCIASVGVCLCIAGLSCQTINSDLKKLEQAYLLQPKVYQNYQNLQWILVSKYEALTPDQRRSIRSLLNKSSFSAIVLCPATEVGKKIIIKGTITNGTTPITSARIVVFQTDNRGCYAPNDAETKRMSESEARLYGALLTNEKGEFEIQTIHPGTYPFQVEGRFIPQHIHINISAEGYSSVSLQMAFEDDPAMKDSHWQRWARDLKFPVVKLNRVEGVLKGTVKIILEK